MRRSADKGPGPDQFGFLPYKCSFEFDGGTIITVPEFDEGLKWVEERLHEDGFLYPPLGYTSRVKTDGKKKKVPHTERPALFHPFPTSHELSLARPLSMHTRRDGDAAFVIHWLGYIFETRLQFSEWWHDGRIRIKQFRDPRLSPADTVRLLSHDYRVWSGWNEEDRKRFINILYMHCRVPSYEWDWEMFTMEYMVLDACWKMAERLYAIKNSSHKERLRTLSERFSIPMITAQVDPIVNLRNDLFHETLWDGERPCGYPSERGSIAFGELRRFNRELIGALFGAF
jgi:hypothetical protein